MNEKQPFFLAKIYQEWPITQLLVSFPSETATFHIAVSAVIVKTPTLIALHALLTVFNCFSHPKFPSLPHSFKISMVGFFSANTPLHGINFGIISSSVVVIKHNNPGKLENQVLIWVFDARRTSWWGGIAAAIVTRAGSWLQTQPQTQYKEKASWE